MSSSGSGSSTGREGGLVGRAKLLLRSFSSGNEEAAAALDDRANARMARTMPAPSAAGGAGSSGSNRGPAIVSVSAGSSTDKTRQPHHHRRRQRAEEGDGAEEGEEGLPCAGCEAAAEEEDCDENPFAGPIKVSITTPGSAGGSHPRSRHSAAVAELLEEEGEQGSSKRRSGSGESGGVTTEQQGEGENGDEEDDEGEGEDDDDEEEEEPAFDPRKAHETFILRALQGLPAEGAAAGAAGGAGGAGAGEALLSQSLRKRLKWADEDGGELNNVQYFDKGAEPSQVLRMMLAADARAEGAMPGFGGAARAAMGREEIVKSLEPFLAQLKGHIQEVLPVKLMRNGTETRTVFITGKGPIRQRVGVAIVWMGGLVKHLKIMRNPEPEFLEEDQPAHHGFFPGQGQGGHDTDDEPCSPSPLAPGGDSDGDSGIASSPPGAPGVRTPTSTEAELLCLDPPYLVPRPHVFPAPTLLVEVVSAHNLKSSAKLPRPVNPYVKLKLGATELRTNVLTNTKNPVWGGQDAHSRFRFQAPDPNALLRVTVGDWKIGKNLWIARLALPLASIEVASPGNATNNKGKGKDDNGTVEKTYALRLRVSRFGKHIEREGASDARLVLRFRYDFPERAWTMQELKARDEARLAEEMEALALAEAEASSSSRRFRSGGGGDEAGAAAAAAAVAASTCGVM